jgi:hypothetical protein
MKQILKCHYDTCGYQCHTHTNLDNHIRVHTKEKPFKCHFDDCKFASAQKSHLTTHLRIHSGDKKYVCDFLGCDFRCTSASGLRNHKFIHKEGPKEYQCDHAGCTFESHDSSHLTTHMRVHSGEKPFACSWKGCESIFSDRSALRSHEKTHRNIRLFPCSFGDCGYVASRKAHLRIHQDRHLGERKYPCDYMFCDHISTNCDDLRTHKLCHLEKNQIRLKKKEEAVARVLKAANIEFKREHHIDMSCVSNDENKFVRIDFLIIKQGNLIILEVDENCHRDYPISCDSLRPFKIAESLALGGNTLPIGMIRLNPDAYKIDGKLKRVSKKDRYAKLIETIKNWKQDRPLAVHYMYYDVDANGDLCIANDVDFRKEALAIIQ